MIVMTHSKWSNNRVVSPFGVEAGRIGEKV